MSDESFLGRWSRRKQAPAEAVEEEDARVARELAQAQAAAAPVAAAPAGEPAAPPDLPPIDSLTPEADFRPFMQPEVPPQLKNAALKKLFSDPHFNVMDGLDTYIDDYTKEDPIPEAMLRGLVQSRALKLFDYSKEEAEEAAAKLAREQAEQGDMGAAAAAADLSTNTPALPEAGAGLQPQASAPNDASMPLAQPTGPDGAAHQ